MFRKLIRTVAGDPNERKLARYWAIVDQINALEPQYSANQLNDEQLREKTAEFKRRHAAGEKLDALLPEAFAAVREASRRTIGLRHYDVQLIGGMVLHDGKIAEMKTGEGKTLVATLPLYLNALLGRGVHLVTPNDYLSKYGLQTMGPVYHALGLTAAVIQNTGGNPNDGSFMFDPEYNSDDARYQNLRPISRREAYHADITYGTNNEFGFDYLRDNMVYDTSQLAQRELFFAIVDEVDNILIDEARTPLIISGQADAPSDYYRQFAEHVRRLKRSSDQSVEDEEPDGDYVVDIKDRIVYLTEAGVEKIEKWTGFDPLYSPEHADVIPYVDNCLRAQTLYHRDHDYVVQDGQVIIVDEFTGRLMIGRRFSEGLHQAIEAKEGVQIRRENLTMATITFQNFFRMYKKLGGMTGTAMTEQEEFLKIYDLEVTQIPTNLPVVREDNPDLIYMTEKAKFAAVVAEVKARQERQQPVLIGTVAIETSERLSGMLKRAGVKHEVLNAKQHEREAGIIAQAGSPGQVTIATNMAGRGVDILLGGNPDGMAREKLRLKGIDVTQAAPEEWEAALADAKVECARSREIVLEQGGLYVLGTERHEARRIDNQLRGRAGRQGDPGETRFFLSLEDDLMKRFGGDRVKGFMTRFNMAEDEPIEHRLVSSSITQAQVRVEGHNFDIRKRVLEYDDVVNVQRNAIYKQRREVLESEGARDQYLKLLEEEILAATDEFLPDDHDRASWDVEGLHRKLYTIFPVPEDVTPETLLQLKDLDAVEEVLLDACRRAYAAKEAQLGTEMPKAERLAMLASMDRLWQRHLTELDVLREGIGLMAVAQRDPLVEYKREAFAIWQEMQKQVRAQAVQSLFRMQINAQVPVRRPLQEGRAQVAGNGQKQAAPAKPEPVRKKQKLSRNDLCHCGSGKKYKDCHLKEDERRERELLGQ